MEAKSHYHAKIRWRTLIFVRFSCALWMLAASPLPAANFYSGISPATVPWPGGIVPYEFTNTLTTAQTNTYLNGLREWQLAANVSFVPHTTQTHWILFAYNTNGFDNVSGTTNPQVVTISSLSRAQVCHEMGHSFGFTHENIRPDQTNYLTVLSNNVTPGYLSFFQVDPTTVTNGPYDFESVMHLGWDFASTNPGVVPTQQPKPPYFPRYQFRMGNLTLSPGDRAALKFLYGAPVVPLTNIVTTTADSGPGSLRAAMYYVTDHPGSVVKFNIPSIDPGHSNGVYNIHLTGHLPILAANGMVIDGSTQPGFTNQPLIVVDGSQIIPETFTSNSGLLIYSASNQVKNISFRGFNWNGLTLEYADATNNTISGCWLGLDATGSNAAPNAFQGILVASGASRNTFGGTNPDGSGRNVISGNSQYGIFITDSNTTGNVVLGNYIGTDASGSNAVPNGKSGALIGAASGNVLGSTNPAGRNIFSGNTEYGIYLTNTTGNVILGNYIGVNAGGEVALANQKSGVALFGGTQNVIGGTGAGAGNVIAFSGGAGVLLLNANTTNNTIRGNSIFANGFLGINFNNAGVTNNDIGDGDTGPNNLQNFPIITNAFGYATSTIILGKLNSATNRSFFIDVYRNTAADPSGYGEGQFYLGDFSVTTDGSGNATFAYTNSGGNYTGQYLTATAMSAGGDTSEFSLAVLATNKPAPSAQFTAPYQSRTNGFAFSLTLQTNFGYRIQAATNLVAPIVWTDLTNFNATNSSLVFTDRTATNYRLRFYRVVSP